MIGMVSVSLWPSSAEILFYIFAIQKNLRIFLNRVFTRFHRRGCNGKWHLRSIMKKPRHLKDSGAEADKGYQTFK